MGTEGAPAPSGWYQDPWGPEGTFRYWSGAAWTQQVSGTVRFPDAGGDTPDDTHDDTRDDTRDDTGGDSPGGGLTVVGIGGLALAILVVATIVIISRGQDVGEINTPVLGITFTSGQLHQAQPGLEARLADLEQHAAKDPPDVPATAVDLTGTWWSAGASYAISQYGAEVVVQEISAYGTTGIGYGVFDGQVVQIQYEAADGSSGFADFTLVDADTLSAVFRNTTHGVSVPAVLTRS